MADWYQLASANADLVVLADNPEQILQAKREGRVAVLLGFQNTSPFGDDYRMVEVFHRLGVRIAKLTYNIENLVGGSCYDENDSGLTAFGRIVIAEMNRVGMLVDLSHVGNRTCLDAIAASATPVAITHSNPTWFVDTPRNKPNEVIEALAARGGIIGCCLYPNVLGGEHTTRDEFWRHGHSPRRPDRTRSRRHRQRLHVQLGRPIRRRATQRTLASRTLEPDRPHLAGLADLVLRTRRSRP